MATTPSRRGSVAMVSTAALWDDGSSESGASSENEPLPTVAPLIPPSPQLPPGRSDAFWNAGRDFSPASPSSRRPTSRPPFDLDAGLARWKGNVFWGYGRRRHVHERRSYGAFLSTSPLRNETRSTSLHLVGYRSQPARTSVESLDCVPPSPSPSGQQHWLESAFRPSSATIDHLLHSAWRRVAVLVGLPVALVLAWCGVPFPTSEPYSPNGHTTWVDANFWFFLFWYFGCYVAVALIYITQLFTLYRLNWWPASLGAKTSYSFFWALSLMFGYLIHRCAPLRMPIHGKGEQERQWQIKTFWVLLTFATMAMPACVCLIGLRRRGRARYRPVLTDVQRPFTSGDTRWRIPSSYRRFLWFMAAMGLTLLTLLLGQGYAIVYMRTLPHSGIDGTLYVAFWMFTVHLLSSLTQWIMGEKVRNRSLLFVFKYYYFMVYFIFYRNLFARLRSIDQFALVQLLSSTWVCVWYPFNMTPMWLRVLNRFSARPLSHEEHLKKISLYFYLRKMAQNTTMLAFLGWLSILHFGINRRTLRVEDSPSTVSLLCL